MSESSVANVEVLPDVVVLRATIPTLDEDQVRRIQIQVRETAELHSALPFALELSSVSFVSSMSLAALIRIGSEFRSRQQRFMLVALQPNVRNVILITRLDRLFELHDDLDAARRSLGPG